MGLRELIILNIRVFLQLRCSGLSVEEKLDHHPVQTQTPHSALQRPTYLQTDGANSVNGGWNSVGPLRCQACFGDNGKCFTWLTGQEEGNLSRILFWAPERSGPALSEIENKQVDSDLWSCLTLILSTEKCAFLIP